MMPAFYPIWDWDLLLHFAGVR